MDIDDKRPHYRAFPLHNEVGPAFGNMRKCSPRPQSRTSPIPEKRDESAKMRIAAIPITTQVLEVTQ